MAGEHGRRRPELVGRDEVLGRLTDHVLRAATPFRSGHDVPLQEVDTPSSAGVLLLGEAGTGKSALLAAVTEVATADGFLVLSVTGAGGPVTDSFGGLNRLLGGVRAQVEGWDGRLVGAVTDALGWRSDTTVAQDGPAVDRAALLPLGVLAVLTALAEERPVLVCVDDVHALDPGSREVLTAGVRRLSDSAEEGIAVVFGQRGTSPLVGLADACELVDLRPLSEAAANELLDRLVPSVTGRARVEVLRLAAGNPLALVELTRAVGERGLPASAGGHLPVTDTIRTVFARDVADLPPATRRALLLAACGEDRLAVLESPALGVQPEAWEPAELAGMVTPVAGTVRFRHPLLESVVYDAATPVERRVAHASLADVLAAEPGRSAWQRSAGLTGPDERTASDLAVFAGVLAARGDAAAAATVLERAVTVTPDPTARVGRLIQASELAGATGSVAWALELAGQVAALTDDAALRAGADQMTGWAALMDDRARLAVDHLLGGAERALESDSDRARELLGTAASPVYVVGSDAVLERYRRTWERTHPASDTDGDDPHPAAAWVLIAAVARPEDDVARRVDAVGPPPRLIGDAGQFAAAIATGGAALFLDRPEQTIAQLTPVIATMRQGGYFMPALNTFGALVWALLDTGRWQRAADVTEESLRVNAVPRLAFVDAVARVQAATVTALRGGPDTGAAIRRAEAGFRPHDNPGLAARMDVLRARVATAGDDPERAWRAYRSLFDHAGAPRHRHLTGIALGEVAAAGQRAGRAVEGRRLVEAALARPGWRSAHQQWVDSCARALTATDTGGRGDALAAALAGPDGRSWPFDHALAQLALADLRRRERRTAEAREVLVEATETFARLGARPFEDHARRLLRAAGVTVGAGRRDPLADLPAQQVQIVRMAAQGLTNREIGDALFLSPRTVASHLYRVFPKLGVASRAHLPDVVAGWDTDADGRPGAGP